MRIDFGYHWSPRDCRLEIAKNGLAIGCQSRLTDDDYRPAYICLAPTPSRAWGLLGDLTEVEEWDLWQVALRPDDQGISLRNDGTHVIEVRVHHTVSPADIWLVGSRSNTMDMESI